MVLPTTYNQERYFSSLSEDFKKVSKRRRVYNVNKLAKQLKDKRKKKKDKEKKDKSFSEREIVPRDIALKGKKEGVVQQDHNGDWRIISYKQNPPEFWDAHYDTKEDAEKALGAYHAQKHYSHYDKISDDDLDDEIYKRALKKHKRRTILKGTLLGGITGAVTGFFKHKIGFGNSALAHKHSMVGAGIGAASGALGGFLWGNHYMKDAGVMDNPRFQKILKKEYEKAYKNRPQLTQDKYNEEEEDDDNTY